jgi:spore coat polysaccharide biosynthesis predicted glycosyltransferase SpsG
MTPGLVVTVLAEAGRGVGLGHLRRCQALATALAAAGANVEMAVAGEGWEPAPAVSLDWLGDTAALRAALDARRPDVVVVDSYRAEEPWLRALRGLAPCVVAIDDLADRALPVSIVINGAWHADRLAYRTDPDTLRLLGSQYALLDPIFAEPTTRPPAAQVRRVLVTLGGDADTAPLLAAAVAAVQRVIPDAIVDVAAVAPTPALDGAPGVTVHRRQPSLRRLIAAADLVVSGGGMTLYECLASGAPVVATVLADNQRLNVAEMARVGLIVAAEPSLEAAVARVAGDPSLRRALCVRGRESIDGRGATRVAAAIVGACRAVGLAGRAR